MGLRLQIHFLKNVKAAVSTVRIQTGQLVPFKLCQGYYKQPLAHTIPCFVCQHSLAAMFP
jgi:hypothetical protein